MVSVKVNRVPQEGWAKQETKAYIDTSKPAESLIADFILRLILMNDALV
jgi:hypothetical protein